MNPYRITPLTLAPGASIQIRGDVRYIKLLAASAPTSIRIRLGSSRRGLDQQAQEFPLYGKIGPLADVDVFELSNVAGGSNTVKVFHGTSDFALDNESLVAAVSVADGADAAIGAKADATATSDGGTFSLIALVKRLLGRLTSIWDRKGIRVYGQTASMTGTADTLVIAAPAAGSHLVVTSIVAHCTHATVATEIAIKAGAAELFRVSVKAGSATGAVQSFAIPIPDGLPLPTATALNAANITTGSDTRLAAFGFVEAD